jgi:hypothetical protein
VFRGLPDDRCQSPHWGVVRVAVRKAIGAALARIERNRPGPRPAHPRQRSHRCVLPVRAAS